MFSYTYDHYEFEEPNGNIAGPRTVFIVQFVEIV